MRYLLFYLILSLPLCNAQTASEPKSVFPQFELKQLDPFLPGSSVSEIKKIKGPGQEIKLKLGLKILKFNMTHQAYKFPILVQYFKDKIVDMYVRLPSYFLHDSFHQSLINRYGKQQKYHLQDSTAVYRWDNNQNYTQIYSGACSVTCFPIFYTAIGKKLEEVPPNYHSLIDILKMSEISDSLL